MEDLNEAILLDREALDLCPRGHPHRSMSLNNLAVNFSTRYDQHGVMEDLDEAIVLSREALDLRPHGHPHHSIKRFVAIGQAEAAGEIELPSVGAELDNVGQLVNYLATFTRIDGEQSCISRVVEELRKNEWVHFACHGLEDWTQPFESAFALHDGHLTVQRIIGCDLKNPEFAFLSACHAVDGNVESPDEVIHLASAMQFAGFRSVIGTTGAVDDGEANKITSTFYKYMVDESGHLDHTRAAFALNKTMKSVNVPLGQRILYIHLGA